MDATIKINMDNLAFDVENGSEELARILSNLAEDIRNGSCKERIRDLNGNLVGEFYIF